MNVASGRAILDRMQPLIGIHAIEEALRAGRPIERVLVARGAA